MADKKIGDLESADVVKKEDLLIMEQDGIAKNMSGAKLLAYLGSLLQEKAAGALEDLNAAKTIEGIAPDKNGNVTLGSSIAVYYSGREGSADG